MSAVAADAAADAFKPAPLPLCAHCGLPVSGASCAPDELLYCCGGCALAHRLTGGPSGHGQAMGLLMSVGIGAFLAMNVMMLSFVLYSGRGEADRALGEAWVRWALLTLATPALVLLGAPFLVRGLRRTRARRLDTDALVVLGVVAAFALSARSVLSGRGPLYLDTAMGILLFVTIGRYLEAASRARTTDALSALVRQMPEEAARVCGGVEERVPLADLRAGDVVRVRPGERMPVDGVVLDGEGSVSEAEITGEPGPVFRGPGGRVSAGTLSLDGGFLVEARRTGSETTIARIVRLVEEARAGRFPFAPMIERFVALFVPVVLLLAAGTFAFWARRAGTGEAVLNTLSVLLIACPCAIGIAIPLASTAASGRAAAAGILVRSGDVFERLARARRVFFDKTGTLSEGRLRLVGVRPAAGETEEGLLALASAVETGSEHPVATAVREEAAARNLRLPPVAAFRAVPGRGVTGTVDGLEARIGSAEFVGVAGSDEESGTVVHASLAGRWRGALVFRDAARAGARVAVEALSARGVAPEVVSGDGRASVAAFAAGIPGLRAKGGLSPEAKLALVDASVTAGEMPMMVGDGINDAPALSGASVGVTLESGTDLAREVADVTVLGGDLTKLPWLVDLARLTMRTARFNLFWAFLYNGIGLALAVCGLLHPLFGAVAMILSSLLVVLHSQRIGHLPLPGGPCLRTAPPDPPARPGGTRRTMSPPVPVRPA